MDPGTLAVERLACDPELQPNGRFYWYGVSQRFGLVGWGQEFARVVVAPATAPPPEALRVRTFVLEGRNVYALWAGDQPTPSARAQFPDGFPFEKEKMATPSPRGS